MKKVVFLMFIVLVSCVDEKEFHIPDGEEKELVNQTVNSDIKALQNSWNQNFISTSERVYTFPKTNEGLFVSGFVVSSDYGGNFYKKIIIQDSPENPTAGIEVRINKTALYTFFEVGRKVIIKLDGLSVVYEDGRNNSPVDNFHGRYVLGVLNGGDITGIPSTQLATHIERTSLISEVIPKKILISEFHEKYINTLVTIENIQFERNELDKTFAGELSDEYDGMRILTSCDEDLKTILQTSTYSDFKSYRIPSVSGSVKGILTKDYSAKIFVLQINEPASLVFDNTLRCDPVYLECELSEEVFDTVLFEERFEAVTDEQLIDRGWINANINNNLKKFELDETLGNTYMELSAYNSGESPMEVWLISPEIDLSNSNCESLTVETLSGYYNGKVLDVYVSKDFENDISQANWQMLKLNLAEGPKSGYGKNFVKSGEVSLTCLSGKIRIAFRYLGVDSSLTSTVRIDNIRIVGKTL